MKLHILSRKCIIIYKIQILRRLIPPTCVFWHSGPEWLHIIETSINTYITTSCIYIYTRETYTCLQIHDMTFPFPIVEANFFLFCGSWFSLPNFFDALWVSKSWSMMACLGRKFQMKQFGWWVKCAVLDIPSLKLTFSHLNMDAWETILSFLERPIFRGHVKFREDTSYSQCM